RPWARSPPAGPSPSPPSRCPCRNSGWSGSPPWPIASGAHGPPPPRRTARRTGRRSCGSCSGGYTCRTRPAAGRCSAATSPSRSPPWSSRSPLIGQSESVVHAAARIAADVVEHDLRADRNHAGGDRAPLGAGDDDPLVAAEGGRRGGEATRVKLLGDQADPRIVAVVEVQVGHG